MVNDGFIDNTALEIREGRAKVITNPENLGHGSAISTCHNASVEEGVVIIMSIDSNFKHDTGKIPVLAKPITEGDIDRVTGSHFVNERGHETMPTYR